MIRSSGDDPLPDAREESAGNWLIEVQSARLWAALEEIRRRGHTLREVRPTLSLEAAFMHAVSETVPAKDN